MTKPKTPPQNTWAVSGFHFLLKQSLAAARGEWRAGQATAGFPEWRIYQQLPLTPAGRRRLRLIEAQGSEARDPGFKCVLKALLPHAGEADDADEATPPTTRSAARSHGKLAERTEETAVRTYGRRAVHPQPALTAAAPSLPRSSTGAGAAGAQLRLAHRAASRPPVVGREEDAGRGTAGMGRGADRLGAGGVRRLPAPIAAGWRADPGARDLSPARRWPASHFGTQRGPGPRGARGAVLASGLQALGGTRPRRFRRGPTCCSTLQRGRNRLLTSCSSGSINRASGPPRRRLQRRELGPNSGKKPQEEGARPAPLSALVDLRETEKAPRKPGPAPTVQAPAKSKWATPSLPQARAGTTLALSSKGNAMPVTRIASPVPRSISFISGTA